jgi:T4 beta protein
VPTFGARHYIPILKGKAGEFDALSWMPAAARDDFKPLIEIVAVPWDYEDDVPAKAIEPHLDGAATRIARCWGSDQEFFVDTLWLDPDEQAGGAHHLVYLCGRLRGDALPVPVGGLTRGSSHTLAVADVAAVDGRGAALRLDTDDLEDLGTLQARIDNWLPVVGLGPEDVDLVVDFGELSAAAYTATLVAARGLLPALPHLGQWRSFTAASGAFPESLVGIASDSEHLVERLDWKLWLALDSAGLPRTPTFGDHAIGHPSLLDADPRDLRPAANIRYTADGDWLVVKRRWVRRGFDQFRDASQILRSRGEYAGSGHCRGCEFIDACAGGGGGTGNLTTWRAVGTCHHLTTVLSQLASLP